MFDLHLCLVQVQKELGLQMSRSIEDTVLDMVQLIIDISADPAIKIP
jgi:hypothetical protein